MKIQTRILISVVVSSAISLGIALTVFSILRSINNEIARSRVYDEIHNKTDALNLLTARFPSQPEPSTIHQIREIRRSLERLLESLTPLDVREESFVQQIKTNTRELGYPLERLISGALEPRGAVAGERRQLLVSQLWTRTQFIADDTQRLKEISRFQIATAQQHAARLTLALMVALITINAGISFFTGRSIVRMQGRLRQVLAKAEEGDRMLSALMEYVPEGISIADATLHIRRVSRFGQELLGPHEGMYTTDVAAQWKVYHADGNTLMADEDLPLVRALQHGEVVRDSEFVQVNARGERLALLCNAGPIRDADGKITGGIVVWHDITERKQMEKSLKEREERLRAIVETSRDGILMMDLRCGRHVFASPSMERLTGFSLKDLNLTIEETVARVHPEDRPIVNALYNGVAKGEVPQEPLEYRWRVASGEYRWFSNSGGAIRDDKGEIISLVGIIRDVTKGKQMEEDLRRSRDELELRVQERTAELKERADQLNRLSSALTLAEQRERDRIAEVLHDHLQQLMVAAKIKQEMLIRDIGHVLKPAAERVLDLVNQSIKASRILSTELSPPVLRSGNFSTSLEWLSGWVLENQGLKVHLQIQDNIVLGERELAILLFQSTRELLLNVIKHAGVKSAAVTMEHKDGELRIIVSDQGAGFNPASARKKTGPDPGFGLFSINERLLHLGGRFEIKSAPNAGSTISMIVPLEKKRSAEKIPGEFEL